MISFLTELYQPKKGSNIHQTKFLSHITEVYYWRIDSSIELIITSEGLIYQRKLGDVIIARLHGNFKNIFF